MGEFMTGILNTSIVVGMSIAVFSILLSFGGKRYRAKCRKTIWILMAICLLIPFRPIMTLGGYTAEIPTLVLREADNPKTDAAGGFVVQNDREQPVSGQTMQGQVLASVSRKEITAADVFFLIWVCVGAVMTVYYMAGYWKLKRKLRRWSHDCEDADIHKILKEVTDRYGMKRIPKLCILQDAETGPFTTGVIKNIIVLPDEIQNEKDIRFILKHEVLHCKNKDILWKLFFLFVNMIHWFNPFVWLLRRAAEQDMEIACDEEVVSGATKADREEYSDVIMSWVEKSRHRGSAVSTGYVHGVRFLKRRFDGIINGGRKKKGILLIGIACALVLLIGNMVHIRSGEKQMIYNYWGGGWEGELLGEKVLPFDSFWDEDTSNERTVKFVTGLEITFPEEWQGKVLLEKELYVGNNIDANYLLICEKGNADAGIGGIIFSLVYYEYQSGLSVDTAYEKVLGIYKQGEKEYALVMDIPGDRQYSEEDEALIAAYLKLSETQDEVVINTEHMEGYTDLEGIEFIE